MRAFLRLIRKINGIPSEILNIVSVDTAGSIMMESIRAPNSFILIHIEILIPGEEMDHLNFDFSLRMGKGTEFLVITLQRLIGISLAEFCFVAARMINLLDLVMRETTLIIFAASFGTQLMTVDDGIGSSSIQLIVIVYTGFALVVI